MFKTGRVLIPLLAGSLVSLASSQDNKGDLSKLSIEDLMKIEVVSASKRPQTLESTASAISVITQEDIRRSGVRNLADAMRLAPGVQVQQLSGHYYAITIRGFDNPNFDESYGNKLLVLLDGRTLYSPYASTVYWEAEDLMLEDVDRIEVIRGPGGSLYGANAVNGVINIITKSAAQTVGGLTVGSLGSFYKDRLAVRYGWRAGENSSFRIYGKVGTDGASMNPDGSSGGDGGSLGEFGFRGDIEKFGGGSLMLQGAYHRFGIYENQSNPTLVPPYSVDATEKDVITAAHLLGRWSREGADGSQTRVQAYYDLLDYPYSNASSIGKTWDLDVQHRLPGVNGRELVVGGGYRYELNGTKPNGYPYQELIPPQRRDSIFNVFAQSESPLGAKGKLILGAKLEHNTSTGFEFEPNVRYTHQISESRMAWAAVSRAVRTPSQAELNDHMLNSVDPPAGPGDLPTAYISFGNPNLAAEVLLAHEIGFRTKPSSSVSIDLAAFYNRYSNLIHTVEGDPYESIEFGVPVIVIPTNLVGGESGSVWGFEIQTHWLLSPRSHVTAMYGHIQQSHFTAGTNIDTPQHQLGLRLSHELSPGLSLDGMLFWYSAVPELGGTAYAKCDLQITKKLSAGTEFSLGLHDLMYPHHATYRDYWDVPRSVDFKLTSRF